MFQKSLLTRVTSKGAENVLLPKLKATRIFT